MNNILSDYNEQGNSSDIFIDVLPYSKKRKLIEEISFANNVPEVKIYDLEMNVINDGIILLCGKTDPQIYFHLNCPLEKPAGVPVCEITYVNSKDGNLQIYYDIYRYKTQR